MQMFLVGALRRSGIATIALAVSLSVLAQRQLVQAHELNDATIAALKACHDHIWFEVPAFADLPNAAISVHQGRSDGQGNFVVYWIVDWDDPLTKAAGSCAYVEGEVRGIEDFVMR